VPGELTSTQGRVIPVDAKPDNEHRKDVEDENPEESGSDCTWHAFVRTLRFAGGEGDELNTSEGKERKQEGLSKLGKAGEGLSIMEVDQTLVVTKINLEGYERDILLLTGPGCPMTPPQS
jgi:hypothetical protein